MKKRVSVLCALLAVLMLVAFVGCSSSNTPAATTKASTAAQATTAASASQAPQASGTKAIKVGIISLNLEAQYWVDSYKGLKSVVEAKGGTVVQYSSENDVQKEVQEVEDMITKKFDVIVLTCVDKQGIRPALQEAHDAGIPVIVYDKLTDDVDLVKTQINTNDYNIGFALAEKLAKALNYKGDVMSVTTPSVSVTGRNNGFKDCIAKYKDMTLTIGQAANALADTTLPVVESMLQKNPNIVGWLGINETQTTGALSAIQSAGKKDLLVYSLEASDRMRAFMKEGKVTFLIDQQAYQMGVLIGENIYKMLGGQKLEAKVEVPFVEVSKDGLAAYEATLAGRK